MMDFVCRNLSHAPSNATICTSCICYRFLFVCLVICFFCLFVFLLLFYFLIIIIIFKFKLLGSDSLKKKKKSSRIQAKLHT